MRTARVALCLLLAPLVACDCGGEVISELEPDVVITPPALDMGEVVVGAPTDGVIVIDNVGTASLDVLGAEILPLAAGSVFEGPFTDDQGAAFTIRLPERVGVNGSEEATITVTPTGQGRFAATLAIETDDPDERIVNVDVLAVGGPPRIAATPPALDFGQVNEGPGAARTVRLQNTGFDTLEISSITLEGATAFALDEGSPATATLEAQESLTLTVRLDPTAAAVAAAGSNDLTGELVVASNAENGELRVPLSGSVNLAPVAVAVELFTRQSIIKRGVGASIILDGSETTDPEGDPITFTWTLESRPESSFAFLFNPPTDGACADSSTCDQAGGFLCDPVDSTCRQVMRTRFIPDVTGDYRVILRATDDQGAFTEAVVEVLPQDLVIRLTWAAAADASCQALTPEQCAALGDAEREDQCCNQSDLDLHLVRPGGTLGDYGSCPGGCVINDGGTVVNQCFEESDENAATCRQAGTDCAWDNSFPEWGAVGRADDPRLGKDDNRGIGPEIISLNEPEDGVYTVYVHYCLDRNTATEPTEATVEILVEGVLTQTVGAQRIDTSGNVWIAASLLRDQGTWDITAVPDIFESNVPAGLCPN